MSATLFFAFVAGVAFGFLVAWKYAARKTLSLIDEISAREEPTAQGEAARVRVAMSDTSGVSTSFVLDARHARRFSDDLLIWASKVLPRDTSVVS